MKRVYRDDKHAFLFSPLFPLQIQIIIVFLQKFKEDIDMETINIQLQVPNTGKYSLDEFIAKVKEYAEKLSDTLTTPVKSYRDTYMTRKEQEAYVAESLNRALDQMEAHEKNGTRPMTFDEFLDKLD
nr:hypothetical protein [uncultured Prevotella sp.]